MIEDIKKLQEAEEQVKNRLTELTQKKESVNVRESQNYNLQVATHVSFRSAVPSGELLSIQRRVCVHGLKKEVIESHTEWSSVQACNKKLLIRNQKAINRQQHPVDSGRVWSLYRFLPSAQVVLQETRTAVQQQYAVIREALDEEEQTALQCVSNEETKALGSLEEKLGYLQSSLKSIQQGLHVLEGLADAKGDKSIQEQAFIAVRHVRS